MLSSLENVLFYIWIPVAAVIIGGGVAAVRAPGRRLRTIILHFVAGLVFSAVAVELLPGLIKDRELAPLIVGFSLGVGVMLGVKWLIDKLGHSKKDEESNGTGLVMAVGVDMFIDGLLVGVSFAAGAREGVLITTALTIELFFLGLSTSSSLFKTGKTQGRVMVTMTLLALLVAGGAGLGGTLLAGLSGSLLVAVVAFATSALLYLVTEELLIEAHKEPDAALATTMFFVGFLLLLVLEMGSRG